MIRHFDLINTESMVFSDQHSGSRPAIDTDGVWKVTYTSLFPLQFSSLAKNIHQVAVVIFSTIFVQKHFDILPHTEHFYDGLVVFSFKSLR